MEDKLRFYEEDRLHFFQSVFTGNLRELFFESINSDKNLFNEKLEWFLNSYKIPIGTKKILDDDLEVIFDSFKVVFNEENSSVIEFSRGEKFKSYVALNEKYFELIEKKLKTHALTFAVCGFLIWFFQEELNDGRLKAKSLFYSYMKGSIPEKIEPCIHQNDLQKYELKLKYFTSLKVVPLNK